MDSTGRSAGLDAPHRVYGPSVLGGLGCGPHGARYSGEAALIAGLSVTDHRRPVNIGGSSSTLRGKEAVTDVRNPTHDDVAWSGGPCAAGLDPSSLRRPGWRTVACLRRCPTGRVRVLRWRPDGGVRGDGQTYASTFVNAAYGRGRSLSRSEDVFNGWLTRTWRRWIGIDASMRCRTRFNGFP